MDFPSRSLQNRAMIGKAIKEENVSLLEGQKDFRNCNFDSSAKADLEWQSGHFAGFYDVVLSGKISFKELLCMRYPNAKLIHTIELEFSGKINV